MEVKASIAIKEEELALTVAKPGRIKYEHDWIVDLGYSNHMTDDIEKLQDMTKYNRGCLIVIVNNS